ncbi:MAG: hypothetical protein ABFC73_00105 [Clostridiaceae bacterium]
MESHYGLILHETDRRIEEALLEQERDRTCRFFGAFSNADGIVMAKHAVYRLMTMLSGLMNEDSAWYASDTLKERIDQGLSFVEKRQRANGLFDYEICNFDSPPDTAFILKKILPTYAFLKKTGKYEAFEARLEAILKKGAQGLMQGGFHTPNHRWAIASVLANCGALWGEETYLREAERYLAEGIDINGDGEYAERSSGNYNRVNNDSMLMLAQALSDDRYEAYAARNLTMMLSYIEPDGSIFTENSTRFDKDLRVFPRYYYWQYLLLGHKHQREDFLQAARAIMERVVRDNLRAPDLLIQFMNQPELIPVADTPRGAMPHPSRFFEDSGVVRDNTADRSVTVLAHHPAFLHVQYGGIGLAVELQGGFFEHRGFVGDAMTQSGEREYTLNQTMRGWYYLPFASKPETADWWAMDHSKRPMRPGPTLSLEVKTAISNDKIALYLRADGVENAPFRLVFTALGAPIHVGEQGELEICRGRARINIGPAFHEFGRRESDLNAAETNMRCFTCYTPFEKEIEIRFSVL